MNKLILSLFILLGFSGNTQNFGIAIKNHPFYNIIEWKGKGGLLMSRSPKEILNQINLTLVGELEEGIWDQKINPKIRDPYYIFNEDTKYIYFLDNLDLVDNGRATFNQMNSGGNIKSKELDIGSKVKAMEGNYDYNKFQFVDAQVTDKALVYHYRYYDKKEKEFHEFAVFMTHHNLIHYVFKLGYVDAKNVEAKKNGQWKYAGFEGETIFFAWRGMKTDIMGWTVKGYSPKGMMTEDHFLLEPKNLRMFRNIGYGNTGKYYTKEDERHTMETGLISYMNGKFYVVVIQNRNNGSELVLLKQNDEDDQKWDELNAVALDPINEETDEIRLGTFPIHEGITYHYKHNGVDKVGILHFEKGKIGEQENFTEQSVYNPSRLLVDNEDDDFVAIVPDKILVCNYKQFANNSGISFQHR